MRPYNVYGLILDKLKPLLLKEWSKDKRRHYIKGEIYLFLDDENMEKLGFSKLFKVIGYEKYPTRRIILRYQYSIYKKKEYDTYNVDVSSLDLTVIHADIEIQYLDFLTLTLLATAKSVEDIENAISVLYEVIEKALLNRGKREKAIYNEWMNSEIGELVALHKAL